ncbi:MAG TPA: hypothetical protein VN635_13980 [Conexibacter sp.]|nr:hypothetical protein [Conexibacter sp.]
MAQFILMLTRDDVTVPNALELVREAVETPVAHIGFKDIGLPFAEMQEVVDVIHGAGRSAHLEVVSLAEEDELRSAQTALDLGVDYLLGGTRWRPVGDLIKGRDIRYFPYPGRVEGHPGTLAGSVDEIVADAEEMQGSVDGINLLAYRHQTLDGTDVTAAVVSRVELPVIVAGSIDSIARIETVTGAGAWGFTIGAAALDCRVVDGDLRAQLEAVVAAGADAGVER